MFVSRRQILIYLLLLISLVFSGCRSGDQLSATNRRLTPPPHTFPARDPIAQTPTAPVVESTTSIESANKEERFLLSDIPQVVSLAVIASNSHSKNTFLENLKLADNLGADAVLLPPGFASGVAGEIVFSDGKKLTYGESTVMPVFCLDEIGEAGFASSGIIAHDSSGVFAYLKISRAWEARLLHSIRASMRKISEEVSENSLNFGAITIFTDVKIWEGNQDIWNSFLSHMSEFSSVTLVAMVKDSQLQWEAKNNIYCVTIPREIESDLDLPGLFWFSSRGLAPRMNIIATNSLVEIGRFHSLIIKKRQSLLDSMRISDITAERSSVFLQLTNTSDETLDFSLSWNFQDPNTKVDPQLLGFSLQPGESFDRQRFRITHPDIPIKFLKPTLTVGTAFSDAAGEKISLKKTLVPWCALSGSVPFLRARPIINGDVSDWSDAAFVLGHSTQIVRAENRSTILNDFSASLHLGHRNDFLIIGVRMPLRQSMTTSPEKFITVCVDLRQGVGGRFTGENQALLLRLDSAGNISSNQDAAGIISAVKKDANLVSAEFLIPSTVFEDGVLPTALRLESIFCDHLDPAAAQNMLMLSGNDPALRDSTMFGVFDFHKTEP